MGSLTTEGQSLQEKFAHDPRTQRLLGDVERGRMCACMSMAKELGRVNHAYETVKQLKNAGVPIIV
jgi:hypothetical protein